MKYHEETLQLALSLSTHKMEGKLKMLEMYPKSEKNIGFYPIFFCIADFHSDCVEQNCHVLVMTFYNLNPTCQHLKTLKNLNTGNIPKSKETAHVHLIFLCIWLLLLRCL